MDNQDNSNSLLLLCQAIPLQNKTSQPQLKDHHTNSKKVSSRDSKNEKSIATHKKNDHSESKTEFKASDANAIRELKFHIQSKINNTNNSNLSGLGKPPVKNVMSKIIKLESIPTYIFGAFNAGDMSSLNDIIESITLDRMTFRTESLHSFQLGRKHFLNFFKSLEGLCPDLYITSNNLKVVNDRTVTTAMYMKGTKILSSKLDHYAIKPGIVDNMNLALYNHVQIARLRELEYVLLSQNKPIEIEFVGVATFIFDSAIVTPTEVDSTTSFLPSKGKNNPIQSGLESSNITTNNIINELASVTSAQSGPGSNHRRRLQINDEEEKDREKKQQKILPSPSSYLSSLKKTSNNKNNNSDLFPSSTTMTSSSINGIGTTNNTSTTSNNNNMVVAGYSARCASDLTASEQDSLLESLNVMAPMDDIMNNPHKSLSVLSSTTQSTACTTTDNNNTNNSSESISVNNTTSINSTNAVMSPSETSTTKGSNEKHNLPSGSASIPSKVSRKSNISHDKRSIPSITSHKSNGSTTSSVGAPTIFCPSKICSVSFNYYLKSFREVVIMPT